MTNYNKLYAIKRDVEGQIKKVCPNIQNKSGLYFYTRESDGFKFCYVGKSVKLIDRLVSHSMGYEQHIDLSLKKYKLFSDKNPDGWKISYKYFPLDELDQKEREYILKAHQNGYQLYNVEIGGTVGKSDIGIRREPKGYKKGVEYGYLKAKKEVANLFEKHLDYACKNPNNKNHQKAKLKFEDFLRIEKE